MKKASKGKALRAKASPSKSKRAARRGPAKSNTQTLTSRASMKAIDKAVRDFAPALKRLADR